MHGRKQQNPSLRTVKGEGPT